MNVVLTIYKDMVGIGYQQLLDNTILPHKFSDKSFRVNVSRIRKVLYYWGKSKIQVGDLNEWKALARHASPYDELKDVCLWMDSTDLKIHRGKKRGGRSEFWSGKLIGPGRRFMTISDAKGKIRRLYGGYSPKFYDGHFLEAAKTEIEDRFSGAGIIADTHFNSGGRNFEEVNFSLPIQFVNLDCPMMMQKISQKTPLQNEEETPKFHTSEQE